ncbi:MAG: hypothetical protein QXT26_02920 [Thermoproteota archaeon]
MRRDRRGQFVVLAAVILAAFMFSMVLSISQLSTSRLEVTYKPVDEVVLTIAGDFERSMTRALAEATQNYSITGDMDSARESGGRFIQNWLRAAYESYNDFGVNIVLAPENSTGKNVGWTIEWSEWEGKSVVYTTFGMDVEVYGLSNLAMISLKAVYLDILDAKIELNDTGGIMTIIFRVQMGGKGHAMPISDISQDKLKLLANGTKDITKELIHLGYVGRGIYEAKFNLTELVIERFTLRITTNDGIVVAADLPTCIISLASDDLATSLDEYDNEGYFIVNGVRQHTPLYSFCLFPNQNVEISFTPPENARFIGFSTIGPISLMPDGSTAMVYVHGTGLGGIIAYYNSSAISATEYCYLTLKSGEYVSGENYNITNLGTIELNGTIYDELPVENIRVPFNETLPITYYPETGYVFKYWSSNGSIIITNPSSPSTYIKALGNGTIIAVYEKSRPEEWRFIYINPEKEGSNDFVLTPNEPRKEKEIQPISYGQNSREGNSTDTTPELFLGKNVTIVLFAKASSKNVVLSVTLGFYDPNGNFNEIISGVITVIKSNTHLIYTISSASKTQIVPEGSRLTLIFERTNMDPGGGTLHILCGSDKSKIELW